MSTVTQQRQSVSKDLIEERIEEAKRALWWSEVTRASLTFAISAMVVLLLWLVVDHWIYSPGTILRSIFFVGFALATGFYLVRRWWPIVSSSVTDEYAAWSLEKDHTDYRQQLTSYVTLRQAGKPRGIRAKVVHAIGTRAASLLKTFDHLPSEATGTFRWWIAAAGTFALLVVYLVASPKSSVASWKRLAMPLASLESVRRVTIRDVQPKATSALAGRSIDVSAVVDGLRDDELVFCRWFDAVNQQSSELSYDATQGRFLGELTLSQGASGSVQYTIEAGDAVAGPYEIAVEDVPVVAVQSIRYRPPAYTKRSESTSSSPAITALDGTNILMTASTSRPVVRAELQFNCREVRGVIEPTAGTLSMVVSDDGMSLTAQRRLRKSAGTTAVELDNYRIKVWDAEDRSNPEPILYPINVIADLPPEVSIVVPTKSPIKVQLDAQQIIEVHAMDADFELDRVSLELRRGLDPFNEPMLWQREPGESGRGNQVSEFRFRPLEQGLKVGDTVKVTAIAVDNRSIEDDPKVFPNRSTTDVLEIRITEAAGAELPDDPSGNDGLSKPDNRPASDAEQKSKEQGSGKQDSQQQGNQSGGGGQESGQQRSSQDQSGQEGSESGGTGASQENSTQEPSDQQGSGQEGAGESESSKSDDKMDGNASDQGSSSQSGDANADGQPTSDGQPQQGGKSSPDSASRPDGQPEGKDRQQDASKNDQGPSDGGDGSSMEQEPSTGRQDSSAGSGSRQQGSRSDGSGSDPQSSGSDPQSSGSDPQPSGENSPNDSTTDGSGANSDQGSQGDPNDGGNGSDESDSTGRSPKHDGEAMERIKDHIERKRQAQKNGGSGQSDDRQDRSGNPESNSNETSSGNRQPSDGSQSPKDRMNQAKEGSDASKGGGAKSEQGASQEEESSDSEGSNSDQRDGSAGSEASGNDTDRQDDGSNEGSSQKKQEQNGEPSREGGEADADSSDRDSSGDEQSDSNPSDSNPSGKDPSQRDSDSDGSKSAESAGQENSANESEDGRTNPQEGSESSNDGSRSQASDDRSQSRARNRQDQANQPSSSSTDGSGSGQQTFEGDSSFEPPPPPDVEYAKEATDMVLDYLDETRDQVDQELLDDLNWTKEDLRRFQKRWEKVRELDQPQTPTAKSNELEEALRSLGLNPQSRTSRMRETPSDGFQNLRDSGNRRRAPSAFRDAFEAFRKRSR